MPCGRGSGPAARWGRTSGIPAGARRNRRHPTSGHDNPGSGSRPPPSTAGRSRRSWPSPGCACSARAVRGCAAGRAASAEHRSRGRRSCRTGDARTPYRAGEARGPCRIGEADLAGLPAGLPVGPLAGLPGGQPADPPAAPAWTGRWSRKPSWSTARGRPGLAGQVSARTVARTPRRRTKGTDGQAPGHPVARRPDGHALPHRSARAGAVPRAERGGPAWRTDRRRRLDVDAGAQRADARRERGLDPDDRARHVTG